ncbi:MAG: response regulator [Desulfosarcinaceae bacterium]|nr:response regulator [Desulfosarcinaceae bacterium]
MAPISTILIVDDEPRLCSSIEALLAREGYHTQSVHSGHEAIARIKHKGYDLVLLDLFIQDMEGYEVLDYINRLRPEIQVIMMTGMASVDSARVALRKGAYDYLRKPFEHQALLKTISNALEHRRLRARHKRAERALRKSEEKYRSVFHNTGTATVIIEADLTISEANAKAADILGTLRPQVEGRMTCAQILHPKDLHRFQQRHEAVLKGADTSGHENDTTFRLIDHRREIKDVILQIGRIPGTRRCVVSLMDITARNQAEDALRQSEEKYRSILEGIEEGYYETDLSGRMTFLNEAMCTMLGSPREKLMGRNFRKLVDEAIGRKLLRLFNAVYKSGRGRTIAGKLTRKTGAPVYAEISISLIRNREDEICGFRGLIRDVTFRLRHEKEKRELETRLQQAHKMEAIGTLAGGIAHDFNNILSAILGYTELSLAQAPTDLPLKDHLTKVLKASERARDLVKQILTFSRQEQQELIPVQINSILKEALKLLRASLPSTIEIRQRIDSSATVMADPTQIHQILMNLCTNASHAMESRGGELKVMLEDTTLSAEDAARMPEVVPGDFLKISVCDTGEGIPPAAMERIFDPFYTTKELGKGTGMGLAVVHGIVKSHGGLVTVNSQVNRGTTFEVYLPVVSTAESEEKASSKPAIPKGAETVLYIDDEPFQIEIGKEALERLGYKVVAHANSVKALELFRESPMAFDLVITDMTMPNLTGDLLAAEMMRIRPDIPIIICTGYSERLSEENAEAMGIRGFILKPILIRDMAITIRRVLDQRSGTEPTSIMANSA